MRRLSECTLREMGRGGQQQRYLVQVDSGVAEFASDKPDNFVTIDHDTNTDVENPGHCPQPVQALHPDAIQTLPGTLAQCGG